MVEADEAEVLVVILFAVRNVPIEELAHLTDHFE